MLTAEQLKLRRQGVGSSETAALVGLDPYRGERTIYLLKTEQAEPAADNIHTERGKFLEPSVLAWGSARTGLDFVRAETLRAAAHPLVIATPDGIVPGRAVAEIKCPSPRTYHEWGDDEDDAPDRYVLQLVQEMFVADVPEGFLIAFLGDDIRVYHYERDRALEDQIVQTIERFWCQYVVPRVMPPPDGSKTTEEWIRKRFPKNTTGQMLTADQATEALLEELRDTDMTAKKMAVRVEALQQAIKERIGDNDGVSCPFGRATYKQPKDSIVIDWQALARDLGATDSQIKAHSHVKENSRRFCTYFK